MSRLANAPARRALAPVRDRQFEVFRTPEYVYAGLYRYRPRWFTGKLLDPSAGDGRMLEWAIRHGNRRQRHTLCDIRPEERSMWQCNQALRHCHHVTGDFLDLGFRYQYDAVITNPPFTKAQAFVEHSMHLLRPGGRVCILQSLQWVGTQKRTLWIRQAGLQRMLIIAKRPRWEVSDRVFKGTDHFDYAWFVFKRGYTGVPVIDWIV